MNEKRAFQRRLFQEDERYMIEFALLPKKLFRKFEVALTINLSGSGLLFRYSKPLPHGSLMKLRLSLPNAKKPVKIVGRIVRVEPSSKRGIFNIAVQFKEISYEARKLIDDFCSEVKAQREEQQKNDEGEEDNKGYNLYI